jgi:ribosomal protein S8
MESQNVVVSKMCESQNVVVSKSRRKFKEKETTSHSSSSDSSSDESETEMDSGQIQAKIGGKVEYQGGGKEVELDKKYYYEDLVSMKVSKLRKVFNQIEKRKGYVKKQEILENLRSYSIIKSTKCGYTIDELSKMKVYDLRLITNKQFKDGIKGYKAKKELLQILTGSIVPTNRKPVTKQGRRDKKI